MGYIGMKDDESMDKMEWYGWKFNAIDFMVIWFLVEYNE
jgi:hypothetical protein